MGQRINIQYSVDIEQIPREVGRLLETAFNEYQLLQADCRFDPVESVLSYEMIERLDCIRVALTSVDHGLNDACNIISGYLNYKAQESAPGQEEAPTGEALRDDLEAKIDKFKSIMSQTDKDEVSD